jgi:hypothetical protein
MGVRNIEGPYRRGVRVIPPSVVECRVFPLIATCCHSARASASRRRDKQWSLLNITRATLLSLSLEVPDEVGHRTIIKYRREHPEQLTLQGAQIAASG